MEKKQYIAAAICAAALSALIWIVPAVGSLPVCGISGAACIAVMAAAVKFGGLEEIGHEDN